MLPNTSNSKVYTALRKLWSPYYLDVVDGKEEILHLGSVTIEPLVLLLSDLVKNSSPRFPIGKGEEGKRAIDQYVKAVQSDDEFVDWKILSELAINSRLMADAVYLLGKLRAQKAIPVLLKIMENSGMLHGPDMISREMKALYRIGTPTVPYLVQEIKEAFERAAHFEPCTYGFSIVIDEEEEIEDDSWQPDNPDDYESFEGQTKEIAYRIRKRAVMILGKLGEPSVLPFLDRLLQDMRSEPSITIGENREISDSFERGDLIDALEKAIKKIKNEPEEHYGSSIPRIMQVPYQWDND